MSAIRSDSDVSAPSAFDSPANGLQATITLLMRAVHCLLVDMVLQSGVRRREPSAGSPPARSHESVRGLDPTLPSRAEKLVAIHQAGRTTGPGGNGSAGKAGSRR